MEFHTNPVQAPANSVACLAQITLGSDGPRHSSLMALGVDASSQDRADQGIIVRKVYWRASVGVTADSLVVTPLSNPPNPLLDNPPAQPTEAPAPEHDTTTLSGKIAHLFHHDHKAPVAKPITDFPGTVNGQPLAAITVPLKALDVHHYSFDTSTTPSYLLIPVISDDPRGAATLRFEFDNWLSAKADVEILATQIHQALHPNQPARAQDQQQRPELTKVLSQEGIRRGRDNDGSTHPTGDAPYREGWQKEWQGI